LIEKKFLTLQDCKILIKIGAMKTKFCTALLLSLLLPILGSADSAFYYHLIKKISPDLTYLQLEDGSKWAIHVNYRCLLRDWRIDDSILISPNHRFELAQYDLTNSRLKTFASASLQKGPHFAKSHTFRISEINEGEVAIENLQGNYFSYRIDPRDLTYLEEWEVGQPVIIGTNEWYFSHLFSDCKHILINPDLKHFIRAKLE